MSINTLCPGFYSLSRQDVLQPDVKKSRGCEIAKMIDDTETLLKLTNFNSQIDRKSLKHRSHNIYDITKSEACAYSIKYTSDAWVTTKRVPASIDWLT